MVSSIVLLEKHYFTWWWLKDSTSGSLQSYCVLCLLWTWGCKIKAVKMWHILSFPLPSLPQDGLTALWANKNYSQFLHRNQRGVESVTMWERGHKKSNIPVCSGPSVHCTTFPGRKMLHGDERIYFQRFALTRPESVFLGVVHYTGVHWK